MRRIFLIFILLVILSTLIWLGYLGWQYFNQATNSQIEINNQPTTSNQPASSTTPAIKSITNFSVANYWVNATSSEIFIINYNGKIEKINSGIKSVVSDQGLKNIFQIIPSPDATKILINLTVFDANNNSWITLPNGVTAAAWHPQDSQKIAYLKNDGLYLLNLKTSKTISLLKINNRDWVIDWPFSDTIYLSTKPSLVFTGEVWSFNLQNKTLNKLFTNEKSPIIQWSPNNQWGLKLNSASIINKNGQELVNLKHLISASGLIIFPSKCLVVDSGFYCAIPQNLNPDVSLDDYFKKKVYTNDRFYYISIDFKNNLAQAKLLYRENENNPLDGINLSLFDNKLYFINRYDQKIYSLEIK